MIMVKGESEWIIPDELRSIVLDRVKPDPDEMEDLKRTSDDLMKTLRKALSDIDEGDIEPRIVGSIAKGTVASSPDIDIFLIFSLSTPDDILEETGLKVGMLVLDSPQKRYTQHPYITGRFAGYPVDIVPCRRIERGKKVSTAVDRTPHHTEYITGRMSEKQKDDTILLKSFLKGIGAYGAEDTVNGFSGYLCEILILMKGSFPGVIEWFAEMVTCAIPPDRSEAIGGGPYLASMIGPFIFSKKPLLCEIPGDIESYRMGFKDSPLVIIDPVDPGRNVGSPVSDQLLAHTVTMSRKLIEHPSPDFFHPWSMRPVMDTDATVKSPKDADNYFMLDLPEGNPDMIMTQIRSILMKAKRDMEREFDWTIIMKVMILQPPNIEIDRAYLKARYVHLSENVRSPSILVEIETDPEHPPLERIHWGPPKDHVRASDFRRKWKDRASIDEESGRLFVILEKRYVPPMELLMNLWDGLRKGPSFKEAKPRPVENQLINEVIWETSER